MPSDHDNRLTIALLLSLLVHLLLLYLFNLKPFPKEIAQEDLEVTLQGKQIADIAPPEREERPERARFYGLYDSRAFEEQVAPSPYLPPAQRRIIAGSDGRDRPTDEEGIGRRPEGGAESREEGEDLYSVLPEEFFPDLKMGDRTYLSVQRNDRLQYFVRMKKIYKMTWDPIAAIRRSMVFQQIFVAELTAAVAFSIDREGNLKRAFLARSSGIPEYDQEAIRVVTASAPYEVPPDFLLAMDGRPGDTLDLVYYFIVYRS